MGASRPSPWRAHRAARGGRLAAARAGDARRGGALAAPLGGVISSGIGRALGGALLSDVPMLGLLGLQAPGAGRVAAFGDTECIDSEALTPSAGGGRAAVPPCWWLLQAMLEFAWRGGAIPSSSRPPRSCARPPRCRPRLRSPVRPAAARHRASTRRALAQRARRAVPARAPRPASRAAAPPPPLAAAAACRCRSEGWRSGRSDAPEAAASAPASDFGASSRRRRRRRRRHRSRVPTCQRCSFWRPCWPLWCICSQPSAGAAAAAARHAATGALRASLGPALNEPFGFAHTAVCTQGKSAVVAYIGYNVEKQTTIPH